MRFFVYYSENIHPQIQEDHKKCCDKLGLEVVYFKDKCYTEYDEVYSAHGNFMTSVMEEDEEIVCFMDIDALPYHKSNIEKVYQWVKKNQSFAGNAQNISHTQMRNRLYAAAPFLIVSKTAWKQLGSPSLSWFIQDGLQVDTAQILTLRADQIGMNYQMLYPIGYDGSGGNKLSGYGMYGKGTLYPTNWHYFRISECIESVPELWTQRVNNILNDQKIIPNHSSCFYGL